VGREFTSGCVVVGAFDPIVARGLESVLRDAPGLKIVATDVDADALGVAALALGPCVALVDEVLGGATIEQLRVAAPRTGIVVFAKDPTPAYGRLLLASGVSCVASSVSPADLLVTVRLAGLGNRGFIASDGHAIEWREDDPMLLSRREQQVLRYFSRGLSHARIAEELGIAFGTLGKHATRIYQKLGVGGKREAVELFPRSWFAKPIGQSEGA
jgi:DNA-binding NarL/FixJ family response regulator